MAHDITKDVIGCKELEVQDLNKSGNTINIHADTNFSGDIDVGGDTTLSGDLIFNGVGKGLAYCSLYLHEGNITLALTKDVYTHLTGFTQGLCNNTTVTADEIVISVPGVYKVDWSVSAKSGNANQVIDIDLFTNGNEEDDGSARRSFGTANAQGNMGGSAIIRYAIGDSVDLRAKNSTSDADIILFNVNLNVMQVGG